MQLVHPSPQQVPTMFRGGFVTEQPADETDRSLQHAERLIIDETFIALRDAMFEELMKSLRATLSI